MTQVMNNINKNENPMILAMATIAQSVTSVLAGGGGRKPSVRTLNSC